MKHLRLPDFSRRRLLRAGLLAGSGLVWLPTLPGCGGNGPSATDPRPATGAGPRGIHVSFTGDPHTSRTITWFTDGLDDPGTQLEFDHVAPGMSATDMQAKPFAGRVEGTTEQAYGVDVLTHRATMSGLDPALPIRYRVGDGKRWSQVFVLRPASTGRFRFGHFGDHGRSEYSRLTVQRLLERNPDFFLLAGDLSYANGDQPVWDEYFDLLEPLAAQVPMMAAAGNHEDEDNGGLGYKSRTAHPGAGTFYSFDYNNVHFLVSTAGALITDGTLPEELLTIEVDLAQAAARRAAGLLDFIVIVQHFTIWTDEDGRNPANPTLVAAEEDILLRYGVDLLLNGHDHEYQRSHAMAYGLQNPLGYVQVINGNGGVGIRSFSGQQGWSAAQQLRYGFTEYEVDGPAIRASAYALADPEQPALAQPEVMDQFEIAARPQLARREFVRPARGHERLLANFDGIARHTRERNRRHLHG